MAMVNTIPSQTNNKKALSKAATNKTWLQRYTVWATAGAVLLAAIAWSVIGNNKFVVTHGIKNYLEHKYGRKFVVKNERVEGAGLGEAGQNTADAYAVEDPSLRFEAGRYSNGQYYDTYVSALWSRQAHDDVEQAVRSIFGDPLPWTEVTVHPIDPATGRDDRTSNAYNQLPTLASQLTQDRSVVSYNIHVRTTGNFGSTDRAAAVGRLKQLVEFVAARKTGSGGVRYVVDLKDEDAMYVCDISKMPLVLPSDSELSNCFSKFNGRE